MDKLLDMGFGKYSVNQVLYRGQILDQIHVPNGENDIVVGPVTDLFCTLPEGVTADDLTNRVQMISTSVEAPVKFGDKIAVVQLWYGNVCVAQANVQAMNSAKVGQLYTDGNNGSGLFDAGAFSTAVTVLIVIGALILGITRLNRFNVILGTAAMSLLSLPVLFLLVRGIAKIGGDSWKE